MVENRHERLNLSDDDVLQMYTTMLASRRVDERMWLLNRAGKIPFVVSCQGQEGAQVGAAYALDAEKDWIAPYYRDMGVVLQFGMTIKDIMLSAFAKAEDISSGGRQMPNHFSSREHRILTGSSPVTTQVPHAVGVALAAKIKGENLVTFASLGEGSTNQGDFHEGLNFASVHKLPTVIFVENNQYAISVPFDLQMACEKVSDRAAAYGIPGVTVDGTDILAVYEEMKKAVDRARNGEGPTLVEAVCVRLTAHSSDDDQRQYRPKEELEAERHKDPLALFTQYLYDVNVLNEALEQEINAEIMKEIDEATDYAEQAAYAEPESALLHVYAEEGGEA